MALERPLGPLFYLEPINREIVMRMYYEIKVMRVMVRMPEKKERKKVNYDSNRKVLSRFTFKN